MKEGRDEREKRRLAELAVRVFVWCLQMENTPTIMLPSEANAETVDATLAPAAMWGTDRNPTVALYVINTGVKKEA
jgi:hypothetical protein